VLGLTTRIINLGHRLYRNSFPSPDLFDSLCVEAIICCGTVRPNQKVMPSDFGRKLRLKEGDIRSVVKGDLSGIAWKEK
jgi:hypothetical protein